MIEISPIVTEQDYENALKAVEPYFDDDSLLSDEDSAYFDAMITLITRFEETHFEPPRVSRRPNFLREYPNEKYLLT